MNEQTILTAAACVIAFVVGMKYGQAKAAKATTSQASGAVTQDGFWFANYGGLW